MVTFLMKKIRAWLQYDKYSAETVDRVLHSKHVGDLRLIINTMGYAVLLAIALVLVVEFMADSLKDVLDNLTKYDMLPLKISSVLAGFGLVTAWCYQTASGRLGIVDLFACEITTLCRICTINSFADACIKAFELDADKHPPSGHNAFIDIRERFSHFDSSEDYTPIFSSNAKELRSLSVKVVTNITAFYTYWKAMRDALRKLAHTPATTAVIHLPPKSDAWHRAMREVIYMQFLALESARKAVRDLIEFEPNNAENMITILLSELPAYSFLLRAFQENDTRHIRLEMRRCSYQTIVPQVYYHTENEYAKYNDTDHGARKNLGELHCDWYKAYRMLDELKHRYEVAIGEFPRKDRIILADRRLEDKLLFRLKLSTMGS